ncbi:endonuclease NucS [Candidatus Micrarchaeota archaeon]|nr:endonuclease NucS [Candidatus Micrarchaeota archaeon]
MIPLAEAKKIVDEGLSLGDMVMVVGGCKVKYVGRAASKLSEGDRLLLIKHDGTFLVHQSTKMAAINYQGPGARISTELSFDANNPKSREPTELAVCAHRTLPNNAKEVIEVHFHSVLSACHFPLKDDSALQLFGSEKQLSDLLMQDLHLIEKGMAPLQQESDVRKGTIDILARDSQGRLCAIELKRRVAGLDAVTQLARYVKDLSKRKGETIRGILCAPEITGNSLKMLEGEGLEYFKLDYQIGNPSATITGLEKKQKALGEY